MDDNTFKILSLVIGLISTLGLAVIGYFTVLANISAQAARLAVEEVKAVTKSTAVAAVTAAEKVQDTAEETSREAKEAATQVKETLANEASKRQAAAEDVKQTLVDSTGATITRLDDLKVVADNTQRMGEATHTLVNNNMGIQLQQNAVLARRIAELTSNPKDVQAAREAELKYEDHQEKQAIVDSKPSPRPTDTGHPSGDPITILKPGEQVIVVAENKE